MINLIIFKFFFKNMIMIIKISKKFNIYNKKKLILK